MLIRESSPPPSKVRSESVVNFVYVQTSNLSALECEKFKFVRTYKTIDDGHTNVKLCEEKQDFFQFAVLQIVDEKHERK